MYTNKVAVLHVFQVGSYIGSMILHNSQIQLIHTDSDGSGIIFWESDLLHASLAAMYVKSMIYQ